MILSQQPMLDIRLRDLLVGPEGHEVDLQEVPWKLGQVWEAQDVEQSAVFRIM